MLRLSNTTKTAHFFRQNAWKRILIPSLNLCKKGNSIQANDVWELPEEMAAPSHTLRKKIEDEMTAACPNLLLPILACYLQKQHWQRLPLLLLSKSAMYFFPLLYYSFLRATTKEIRLILMALLCLPSLLSILNIPNDEHFYVLGIQVRVGVLLQLLETLCYNKFSFSEIVVRCFV